MVGRGRAACTRILEDYQSGDGSTAARLMPLVYDELRQLAAGYLRGERTGHSLQPTALVHEAYIRLVDLDRIDWKGKTHFFAMAATQMRRILVEHARAAKAQKRAGGLHRITFTEGIAQEVELTTEFLALDQALIHLAGSNPRQAEVAVLRLFSGLLVRETALHLRVSERTVKSDWRFARAWLIEALGKT